MWNTVFQSPPAWILSRRLTSFQRFFELGSEESSSPFLDSKAKQISRNLALKSAIASACLLVVAFLCYLKGSLEISNIVLCFVYLLVGTPALIAAVQDIVFRRDINIDVLTTLAAFGTLLLNDPFEGALLLVLFALAGSLEDLVTLKAKSALCSLYEIRPSVAYLVHSDGSTSERAVEDVHPGDVVIVRSGEMVPLDGIVENSGAPIDLSHLSGESRPVYVKEREVVASGARVLSGYLEVRVTCTSTDSTIANLIRMIAKAHTNKPQLSLAFERYGRLYAALAIGISCILALVLPLLQGIPFLGQSGGLFRAISFLITASPCALIIAIPITYLSALGAATGKGAVLKGWTVLDHLRACSVVAFDKTGTLTTGKMSLNRIIPLDQRDENKIPQAIRIAGSLEKYAVHPVAEALTDLVKATGHQFLDVSSMEALPGSGVYGTVVDEGIDKEAYIGGVDFGLPHLCVEDAKRCRALYEEEKQFGRIVCLLVIIGAKVTGFIFSFEDALRQSSREVVLSLRQSGRRVMMLTGDNEASAQTIASALSIQEVYAKLLPQDKLSLVERLSLNCGLMMVGDGINDAPALARSTVGISMGQVSSASARDSSDIVLLNNDLSLLPWLFSKAEATRAIVRQNLVIAIASILIGTVGSVEGLIPLWVAVCIHEGSTLVVGLNALRLLL